MDSVAAIRKSRYAFVTLPNYSLIALTNAIEPLRMANTLSGQNAYEASIVSLDGAPVVASNGLQLTPTAALDQIGPGRYCVRMRRRQMFARQCRGRC